MLALHIWSQVVDYGLGIGATVLFIFIVSRGFRASAAREPGRRRLWFIAAGALLCAGLIFFVLELRSIQKMGAFRPPSPGNSVLTAGIQRPPNSVLAGLQGFVIWSSNRFGQHDIVMLPLQHDTVDEWAASPAALKGSGCVHCHFPEKERPGRNGGPPRKGRSHLLASWRNRNLDRKALTVRREILSDGKGRKLRVTLVNDRTAHNVPADSRNRALDLVVTFFNAGGGPFPAADGKRGFGQEKGTYRKRFRNPYRSEIGKKNSQIVSGTKAVLDAPVPPGAVRVRIELLYKLNPYSPDEKAIKIMSEDLDL